MISLKKDICYNLEGGSYIIYFARIPKNRNLMCDKNLINHNPLTLVCDQDRISPYNINTISSRQVIRIKKNINLGIDPIPNSPY